MDKSFQDIREELLHDWQLRNLIDEGCAKSVREKTGLEFIEWVAEVLKDVLTETAECNSHGNIALVDCIINLIQLRQGKFA